MNFAGLIVGMLALTMIARRDPAPRRGAEGVAFLLDPTYEGMLSPHDR